jgi:hypothetical protein
MVYIKNAFLIWYKILGLALFVFFTQFYSISTEVINWDESDFILMGESFYNGNLPYLELWDLKPPLHFIYIGTFFKLFNPSLLSARLAGDLIIFLTAVLLYIIARKVFKNYEAIFVPILYISLVSFEFAQPTMTEYLSTFFIIISMLFFEKNSSRNIFLSGIFISLAVFTRTNAAFVWIIFFILLIFTFERRKYLKFYILGSSFPAITLMYLYFIEDRILEFFYSVFLIPLGNTLIRENFIEVFKESYEGIFLENLISIPTFFLVLLLVTFIFILCSSKFRALISENFAEIDLYFYVFIGLILSILAGGRFFYHYLIQLFPFISIFIVFSFSKLFKFKIFIYIFLGFLIVFNAYPLVSQSFYNIQNYQQLKQNYKLAQISNYIYPVGELLALDNHLIYFYLENEPITPIVHPNVIFKADEYELLLTSLVNLGYINTNQDKIILESYPRYILCEDFCFEYIDPLYFEEYDLIIEIDGVKLFEYES